MGNDALTPVMWHDLPFTAEFSAYHEANDALLEVARAYPRRP